MTDTPDPGELLEHIHSKRKYWYVGPVPETGVHAIVAYNDRTLAYTIDTQELRQYYNVVEIPQVLYEGHTYTSARTNSTFYVEKIMTNPDTGKKTAFGWYRFNGEGQALPQSYSEGGWDFWKTM